MPGSYRIASTEIFRYTQSTPAAIWTINHRVNTQHPIVDCWIDMGMTQEKAIPLSVVSDAPGTTVITWSEPQSGVALIA